MPPDRVRVELEDRRELVGLQAGVGRPQALDDRVALPFAVHGSIVLLVFHERIRS
jgi:hypothetical protein